MSTLFRTTRSWLPKGRPPSRCEHCSNLHNWFWRGVWVCSNCGWAGWEESDRG